MVRAGARHEKDINSGPSTAIHQPMDREVMKEKHGRANGDLQMVS